MFEILIAVFFLVVCIFAVSALSGSTQPDTTAVRIPALLTPAELHFYNHIDKALDARFFVLCSKVRLGDLIKFKNGDNRQRWKRLQQVNRKHIDFVVCDRKSMMPIFVMELDDSSHNRRDRKDRDVLVDSFLREACLPILHVKCQRNYKNEVRDVMRSIAQGDRPDEEKLLLARAKMPF